MLGPNTLRILILLATWKAGAKASEGGGLPGLQLKKFFDKAGMSMEDPANKVRIPGHKGPHPEEYHQEVFKRLGDAVKGCETTVQCREALTQELKLLAEQLRTVGSRLNKLVTRIE